MFLVKTNNNPLTYIMTTPNYDTTWHCWVESLAGCTFSIKYQNGWDTAATDALNQVTLRLDVETVQSILDGVTVGLTGRADAHDPVVAETDEEIHKQVWEAAVLARAAHMCVNLHVTDWMATKLEDPVLKAMIDLIPNQKVQDLQPLLKDDAHIEEGMTILQELKKLMLYQGALCHHHTLADKLGEVMWLLWMDVTEMLDTRVSSKHCTCYRTGSGGLACPHRCRKWLATINDASNMKVLVSKHKCSPSLPPLLWSCYT